MPNGWLSLLAPASLIAGAGLLLLAAFHDIVARTVPNWVAGLLALAGLGARIMGNNVSIGLAASATVFVIAALCWRRGWLGGGDVKLMGAATLTVPPSQVLPFIVAMSVSGSILAALYLAAGRVARGTRRSGIGPAARHAGLAARAVRAELWRLRRGGPLPYACAIAAGFIFILF
jgi:prepilin peptidase CpaA